MAVILHSLHRLLTLAGSLRSAGAVVSVLFAVHSAAHGLAPHASSTSWGKPNLRFQPDGEILLGPGNAINITVFQNLDLSVETRVSENHAIRFPSIGPFQLAGNSPVAAETKIAHPLNKGVFLIDPQITVLAKQVRGNQIAEPRPFSRPVRYPMETTHMPLSDLNVQATGIAPAGLDTVILKGVRDGGTFSRKIDVASILVDKRRSERLALQPGDMLFVGRYPLLSICGEVQWPGSYRIGRTGAIVEALAIGGRLTRTTQSAGMSRGESST